MLFWQWNTSDLVSNATRGRLAEYIVAHALGLTACAVRDEWSAYDLETKSGIRLEVKSGAFIQSWHQTKLSTISFVVPRTRAWSPDTNRLESTAKRQAAVYVFALLAHKEKATIDPLNVKQWRFYVVPTRVLNERTRSQHSISLQSLEKLAPPVSWADLATAIEHAGSSSRHGLPTQRGDGDDGQEGGGSSPQR